MRAFDGSQPLGHAVSMRTLILIASILRTAPVMAQDTPTLWRDPDGGCTYFRLGDTLSLRYQRDGLPDCPDAIEPLFWDIG